MQRCGNGCGIILLAERLAHSRTRLALADHVIANHAGLDARYLHLATL